VGAYQGLVTYVELGSEPVPLVDLSFQHAEVAVEIVEALVDVMARGRPAEAHAVEQFETALAALCHRRHCVGIANGTDTLALMLTAAGIGHGAEVIVPANGRLATVAAVMRAGAWPVLADCDPVHQLLDPDDVRRRLTPRTRAVVAMHIYGQMAPMDDLAAVFGEDSAVLFEDAAQCAGGTRYGAPPGSMGRAVVTNFHPGMSLGAYGGGGAVLSDDDDLATRVRSLHKRGEGTDPERYRASPPGHFDAAEAIVLSAKLGRLREWNRLRAEAARLYGELLAGDDRITLPGVLAGNEHVWHRYVVRIPNRDAVRAELEEAGIGAAVHYSVPIHLLPASEMLGHRRGDFPHAEAAAEEILSLPIYPGIRADQVGRVANAVRRAIRR
jgi:dTDP-4-amino-4,6-dideoxygalactose transaminase